MSDKKNIVYTKCFICGRQESLYFKYYKVGEKWVRSPNEFWICKNCFKIDNEKHKNIDGEEFCFYKSWL